MATVLQIYILTCVSFFLFFFNVPYWTGEEMSTLAKNGVYRLAYTGTSTLGWLIYKLVESINNTIDDALKIRKGSAVHATVNLLFYVGVVWSLSSIYDSFMTSFMRGEVGQLQIADGHSYARYSDLLMFWGFINNFGSVDSVGGFFTALVDSFWNIVVFVVLTLFFFSVMYGLLAHKLQEIRLVERFSRSGKIIEILNYEPEHLSFQALPKQIGSSLLDFANNLSVLRNFKIFGVQIAFAVILAVYSIVSAWRGDLPDYKGFALDLLDESGIITTIGSFILSFVFGKLVVLVGRLLYRMLPHSVQDRLHQVSVTCRDQATRIRDRQKAWAERFDSVYSRTLAPWERGLRRVNEMDLEGDYQAQIGRGR